MGLESESIRGVGKMREGVEVRGCEVRGCEARDGGSEGKKGERHKDAARW